MFLRSLRNLTNFPVKYKLFSPVNNVLYRSVFTVQDFGGGYNDSHGEVGSLNTRFIKHIAMNNNFRKIIPKKIKYADFFPLVNVQGFSKSLNDVPIDQIPQLITFIYTYKTNGDPFKVAQIINDIDNFCSNHIDEFDYENLLSTIYTFHFLIPNKITKLYFWKKAILMLVQNFKDDFPPEIFASVCYYLGLGKANDENTNLMKHFLETHLNKYITRLNTVDFAIVANAAFKTSTVVNNNEFQDRLKSEILNCNYGDDALTVTLIKNLRLQRIKSNEILEKLKANLINGKFDKYDFKGLVHIFAYFSDNLWNDSEILKIFIKKCLQKLENEGVNGEVFNDLREKDLATFTWCLSNLQCKQFLNESHLNFIEDVILSRIRRDKYKYCPDELIDTVLSLWMMGYKSQDLVSNVLNEVQNNTIMHNKGRRREKLDSRFKLLLNCICIENPDWLNMSDENRKMNLHKIFDENRKVPNYLIKNKTNFRQVYEFLKANKDSLKISSFDSVLPIDEINLPSIKIRLQDDSKQAVFLEILENDQILQFDDKISTLSALKIRLMEQYKCKILLLKPSDLVSEEVLRDKFNGIRGTEELSEEQQSNA